MARPVDELRRLLGEAAEEPADVQAGPISRAAAEVFGTLRRTDMRSGVANIIRRLAQLHADGDQPIPPQGWAILRDAADLLGSGTVAPSDVKSLDERLQEVGLDVDYRPPMPGHRPGAQHPN